MKQKYVCSTFSFINILLTRKRQLPNNVHTITSGFGKSTKSTKFNLTIYN